MANPFTTGTGAESGIDLLNAHIQWHYGTEPITTYPFLNWADTGNNLWKQRNEADNGWIIRGTLNQAYFGLAQSNLVIPIDGWIPFNTTCTYGSADDPTYTWTISGNYSTIPIGTKIKYTQSTGGTKFAILTKNEYSASNTTWTLYHGTDYDLVNESISSVYYSLEKCPTGFPLDQTKWTVEITNNVAQTKASPVANTWYNQGTISISVPIGVWNLEYEAILRAYKAAACDASITLSTANNSESDNDFTCYIYGNPIIIAPCFRKKHLNLTSKTPYYLNIKTDTASMTDITIQGDKGKTIIRAICTYL
jgi:hypothetical protein